MNIKGAGPASVSFKGPLSGTRFTGKANNISSRQSNLKNLNQDCVTFSTRSKTSNRVSFTSHPLGFIGDLWRWLDEREYHE